VRSEVWTAEIVIGMRAASWTSLRGPRIQRWGGFWGSLMGGVRLQTILSEAGEFTTHGSRLAKLQCDRRCRGYDVRGVTPGTNMDIAFASVPG